MLNDRPVWKHHNIIWQKTSEKWSYQIIFQPKLLSGELLDIVSSHFSLKEKEYFGLSYKDDT